MHFQLPKPLHGWRAFSGEVGIIVLGILIALGLGQVADDWQARKQVDRTRVALAEEIATSAADAAERIATEDCMRARIGELAAKLTVSRDHWTADPMKLGPSRLESKTNPGIPVAYRAPARYWTADAWDTAKATGTINQMSGQELTSYEEVYARIAGLRMMQQQEVELSPRLSVLSFDQVLDNHSRLDALSTLAQLDALNAKMSRWSSQLIDEVRPLHLRLDRAVRAKKMRDTFLAQRQLRGLCVEEMQLDF